MIAGAERFRRAAPGARADRMRSIRTEEGVGDRLRSVAFAELQAREAFLWAATRFDDAAPELRRTWRALAAAEEKHLAWLLARLDELGQAVDARRVSDRLHRTLTATASAEAFAVAMAVAEDAGRRSGERLEDVLRAVDPRSADLFGRIAAEEREHVALAARYFPEACVAALRGQRYPRVEGE